MGGLALGSRLGRIAAAGISPASTALIERAIPSTGEKLPVVGLGTWQTFDVGRAAADRTAQRDVLAAFVAGGGKLVDSSPMYGESERVVGDLVQAAGTRSRVFIATKVWTRGEAAGREQMEKSLALLHADPIDLLQVHNLLDVGTHLKTLRRWKE